MRSSYDKLAPFYDRLKKFVFGITIIEAEQVYLQHIVNKKILIIGGGSGEILEVIDHSNYVWFIDSSAKMIEIAQSRVISERITFIQDEFPLGYDMNQKYDIIISNFFLDLFDNRELYKVIKSIKGMIDEHGQLIVTDFRRTHHLWNNFVLWIMHLFFNVVTGLKNKSIKPLDQILVDQGFTRIDIRYFRNEMIFSGIYLPE